MAQGPWDSFAFLVLFAARLNQGEGLVWEVVYVAGCPFRSFKTQAFHLDYLMTVKRRAPNGERENITYIKF
jgi:hypothetical protein